MFLKIIVCVLYSVLFFEDLCLGHPLERDAEADGLVFNEPEGVFRVKPTFTYDASDKFNYASFDCGATIKRVSRDTTDAKAVLMEDKDRYALTPCSSPLWIVVELCDVIFAETLEISNFERFSSNFKNFSMKGSNLYHSDYESWPHLGDFEAENKRGIQVFTVPYPSWVKYVYLEISSHYDDRFYCPLSLIRVKGRTTLEDLHEEEDKIDSVDFSLEPSFNLPPIPSSEEPKTQDTISHIQTDFVPSSFNLSEIVALPIKLRKNSIDLCHCKFHPLSLDCLGVGRNITALLNGSSLLNESTSDVPQLFSLWNLEPFLLSMLYDTSPDFIPVPPSSLWNTFCTSAIGDQIDDASSLDANRSPPVNQSDSFINEDENARNLIDDFHSQNIESNVRDPSSFFSEIPLKSDDTETPSVALGSLVHPKMLIVYDNGTDLCCTYVLHFQNETCECLHYRLPFCEISPYFAFVDYSPVSKVDSGRKNEVTPPFSNSNSMQPNVSEEKENIHNSCPFSSPTNVDVLSPKVDAHTTKAAATTAGTDVISNVLSPNLNNDQQSQQDSQPEEPLRNEDTAPKDSSSDFKPSTLPPPPASHPSPSPQPVRPEDSVMKKMSKQIRQLEYNQSLYTLYIEEFRSHYTDTISALDNRLGQLRALLEDTATETEGRVHDRVEAQIAGRFAELASMIAELDTRVARVESVSQQRDLVLVFTHILSSFGGIFILKSFKSVFSKGAFFWMTGFRSTPSADAEATDDVKQNNSSLQSQTNNRPSSLPSTSLLFSHSLNHKKNDNTLFPVYNPTHLDLSLASSKGNSKKNKKKKKNNKKERENRAVLDIQSAENGGSGLKKSLSTASLPSPYLQPRNNTLLHNASATFSTGGSSFSLLSPQQETVSSSPEDPLGPSPLHTNASGHPQTRSMVVESHMGALDRPSKSNSCSFFA